MLLVQMSYVAAGKFNSCRYGQLFIIHQFYGNYCSLILGFTMHQESHTMSAHTDMRQLDGMASKMQFNEGPVKLCFESVMCKEVACPFPLVAPSDRRKVLSGNDNILCHFYECYEAVYQLLAFGLLRVSVAAMKQSLILTNSASSILKGVQKNSSPV